MGQPRCLFFLTGLDKDSALTFPAVSDASVPPQRLTARGKTGQFVSEHRIAHQEVGRTDGIVWSSICCIRRQFHFSSKSPCRLGLPGTVRRETAGSAVQEAASCIIGVHGPEREKFGARPGPIFTASWCHGDGSKRRQRRRDCGLRVGLPLSGFAQRQRGKGDVVKNGSPQGIVLLRMTQRHPSRLLILMPTTKVPVLVQTVCAVYVSS
jgi:hypothetical protein